MNISKLVKLTLLLFLITSTSFAQVNTENKRLGLEQSGFSGNIKLTYSVTMGNSELIEFGLVPNLVWRSRQHQVFMLNDLAIVSSDNEDIISEGFSHLRYNFDLTNSIIYELFFQAQFNKAQNLEKRYLAGSGIRLIYLDNKNAVIANGLTGMYEYEELSTGETSEIFRGSFYLSLRTAFSDRLTFRNTAYFQPEFGNLDDYRVLNEGELSISISESISFTSSLRYRYDNDPPSDIKNYDLSLKNGLKYEF